MGLDIGVVWMRPAGECKFRSRSVVQSLRTFAFPISSDLASGDFSHSPPRALGCLLHVSAWAYWVFGPGGSS